MQLLLLCSSLYDFTPLVLLLVAPFTFFMAVNRVEREMGTLLPVMLVTKAILSVKNMGGDSLHV